MADIGGAAVIANLKKMQKEYGKALGITAASSRAAATKVSEPYAAAQNSLRRFIAAAIALGAESDVDPDVIPQAEHLLAPIEELRVRLSARRGRGSNDEEGIDGENPDANPSPAPSEAKLDPYGERGPNRLACLCSRSGTPDIVEKCSTKVRTVSIAHRAVSAHAQARG